MSNQVATGFLRGTGAAINVELGFVPDYVRVVNLTDGDKVHENFLRKVIAFTSGSVELNQGDTLTGATSGATCVVDQVLLDTGSWAGGDAAGWIILSADSESGTFGSENAGINASGTNDITVAVADQDGIDIDTEVAGTTTAATNIAAYVGSEATYAKGFTVGATISEDAKLLGYVAMRGFVDIAQQ